MKFLEWCGLFELGHQTIDEQHRELFKIANSYVDCLQRNNANSKVAFAILNALIQYTQKHFTDEEKIARKYGFPAEEATLHAQLHEKLIEEIFLLNTELSSGKAFNLHIIEQFITDWLIMHVLVEDRKMKPFVAGKA